MPGVMVESGAEIALPDGELGEYLAIVSEGGRRLYLLEAHHQETVAALRPGERHMIVTPDTAPDSVLAVLRG